MTDRDDAKPGKLPLILRAFRHRNYRLFFGGQLISLIGNFLTQVATAWLVYDLTKKSLYLGLVGFASTIPMFFLGPFGGVWVDRLNRRKLLVITQTLAMLQSFALAALAFNHITIWEVIALSLFQGLVNAFDMPGRQAFLVEMVEDRDDLANAIALNSTMVHGARLIGPALAGLLILAVGEAWCFLLDGLSYIAVIVALLAMTMQPQQPRKQSHGVLHDLREGLSYVWRFLPTRAIMLMVALISFIGMPAYSILMPVFGDYFGRGRNGALVLGLLMGASGLGALIGAIYLASRPTVVGLGRVMALASALFGLGLIGFGLSRQFWLSLSLMPIVGFGMISTFATANTILQTLTDDHMRGRVMSIYTMSFLGILPFGNLLAGFLASRLGQGSPDPQITGASRMVEIGGVVCILAAAVFWQLRTRLRQIIWPIYVKKGILSPVAAGLESSTEMTMPIAAAQDKLSTAE